MKLIRLCALLLTAATLATTVVAETVPEETPEPPPPPVVADTAPHYPDWWTEDEPPPRDFLGNGELIDSQRIVFESNAITFISVTTRAGNMFYILIDHRIPADGEDGTSNVYFLTKVNEYDLLSMLYAPDPNDENPPPPPVHPAQTYNPPPPSESPHDTPPVQTPPVAQPRASFNFFGIPSFVLIMIAVIMVGVIGFGIYMTIAKKKKNPKSVPLDDVDEPDEPHPLDDPSWVEDDEEEVDD